MLYYNKITGIEDFVLPRRNLCLDVKGKSSALPGRGSFEALIEGFLGNLQKDFNSTIPTVLATTEKLVKPKVILEKCRVCGLAADGALNILETGENDWLCKEYVDISDGLEMKMGNFDLVETMKKEELKGLCFGCMKIMENCPDLGKTHGILDALLSKVNHGLKPDVT